MLNRKSVAIDLGYYMGWLPCGCVLTAGAEHISAQAMRALGVFQEVYFMRSVAHGFDGPRGSCQYHMNMIERLGLPNLPRPHPPLASLQPAVIMASDECV